MDYIFNFQLHIENIPSDAFRLTYLDCQNDGISQDFIFQLKCFSSESYDISAWGLKKAEIYYKNELFRAGILTNGKAHDKKFEGYFYEFALSSPMAFLKTRGPNRVFVNKTPQEIINTVFKTAGWKASQWRWELKKPLPVLAYRVQYHQADYDFVMELLEKYNLNFIFESPILKISDDLNLKNMTHHVEEPHHYYSKTLQNLLGYDFEKSPRAGLLTAKIEAPDFTCPYMNHEGYYFIKFEFDQSSELLQGSLPVALIAPHFMHFPLKSGTDVAVRFLDGNINRPIIIGVIPDISPESDSYIHRSYAGHECVLHKNNIKINHGNTENFITLAENTLMTSGTGEMNWVSGNQMTFYSRDSHVQEIQGDQLITVQKSQIINADTIDFKSENNMAFSAENVLQFTSTGNVEFKGDKTQLYSENIKICAQENLEINNSHKINLAAQNIIIDTHANLLLQINGVSVVGITGGWMLNTPVLTINAQQISGIQMT